MRVLNRILLFDVTIHTYADSLFCFVLFLRIYLHTGSRSCPRIAEWLMTHCLWGRKTRACLSCLSLAMETPGTCFLWLSWRLCQFVWKKKYSDYCGVEPRTFWFAGGYTNHYSTEAQNIQEGEWLTSLHLFCLPKIMNSKWQDKITAVKFFCEVLLRGKLSSVSIKFK